MKNNDLKKRFILIFVCICIAIFADQFTKYLAIEYLKESASISIFQGILELTYVENYGAAFGILQGGRIFFYIITFVVAVAIVLTLYRMEYKKRFLPFICCLTMILAGAIGNLIDRIVHGYVVDFIYFVPIDFPVFNVADIYVTVSTGVLFVLILFYYKEDEISFLGKRGANIASELQSKDE